MSRKKDLLLKGHNSFSFLIVSDLINIEWVILTFYKQMFAIVDHLPIQSSKLRGGIFAHVIAICIRSLNSMTIER